MKRILSLVFLTALVAGCAGAPPAEPGGQGATALQAMPGMMAPGSAASGSGGAMLSAEESLSLEAQGPFPVNLADIPDRVYDPFNQLDFYGGAEDFESIIPEELAEQLRAEAMNLPPTLNIQQALEVGVDALELEELGPTPGTKFESLDYRDCCGGGGNVPPDPELAVGPNHIIAVVNVAFAIYNKSGVRLQGPTTLSSFFSGTTGCTSGVFDPNVLYDEEFDRFVIGVDGNGTAYCVAATTGSDPLGSWNRYVFPTASGGEFFDYPHAGVGLDAIYMGANIFTGGFSGARVWAMDKLAMYGGLPMGVVQRSTGGEDTPQPMNLHGFAQGTWPTSGPHYILTDGVFNGYTIGVWSWDDPFGANIFTDTGTVNVFSFTGIPVGMPQNVPQSGSTAVLENNDFRVQDAEYRNGDIWTVQTVACNPGSGTVNCIQWTRIDPAGPSIVDAGVYASNGEYRIFSDLAANDCDDMSVGYTKSSSGMYPAVYVTGRKSSDASGTLQAEAQVRVGDRSYFSFDGSPYRWGDYTGMTVDPDGQTFWYLGEYSKNLSGVSANWGTYIGSFSFPDCGGTPQPPGKASNPSPANGATGVSGDVVLNWTAGSGATLHRVYFDGVFQVEQAGTSFDPPGTLAYDSVHTWRIDEKNAIGDVTPGDPWGFTVQSAPAPAGKATNPVPANLATGVSGDVVLSWTAGSGAVSHDVYFDGSGPFNQTGTSYDPPGTLAYDSVHTWRIDEKNAIGDVTPGDPWSFTVQSEPPPALPASNPNPADNATGVSGNVVLSWTAGTGAVSHDVYFDGSFRVNQAGTSYDPPGTLAAESSHSWQINERNSAGVVTPGPLWHFTVASAPKFHISSVDVVTQFGGGNRNRGVATVTVVDAAGTTGVDGVTVSGTFSGDWSGTRGGTTGANGVVVLETPVVKNGSVFFYCVDTASKAGWVFDQGASTGLCGAPPTTGTIAGTVTDQSNGSPIAGASVSADTGQSGTTNVSGNYTLTNVPTGTRTVSVSASGYDAASQQTTVNDGATSTLNFALTPTATGGGTGTLRGTVTDTSGNKLADVTIQVLGGPSGTSNKGGKYSVGSVPEGDQSVTASKPGYVSETVTISIPAGSTVTYDFSLTPQ